MTNALAVRSEGQTAVVNGYEYLLHYYPESLNSVRARHTLPVYGAYTTVQDIGSPCNTVHSKPSPAILCTAKYSPTLQTKYIYRYHTFVSFCFV
jgi:hypothetical protein